jgi:hypothetical protein
MIKQQSSSSPLEQVIYEAQELAKRKRRTVSFALSLMFSNFKAAGSIKEAEIAFVLMQLEKEHKGKEDPIFT